MNEKLVDDIYNSLKVFLIKDIPIEYQNELLLGYKQNLIAIYSKIDVSSNYELAKEALKEIEISKWEDTTSNVRLSEFVKDKAMDDIRYISNKGFKYAEAKVNQGVQATIGMDKCEEAIIMLEKLLNEVKQFNIELARYYVSEGTLDYNFASGKTNDMSLRIGRGIR